MPKGNMWSLVPLPCCLCFDLFLQVFRVNRAAAPKGAMSLFFEVFTSDNKDIAPFRAAALFTSKIYNKRSKQKKQGKGTNDHILPLGI